MRIRQILERKEIILRKKRLVTMLCCIVVLIALYVIITWPGKQEIEPPVSQPTSGQNSTTER